MNQKEHHNGIAYRVKEMTTKFKDPEVIAKVEEFNEARRSYNIRKKEFNANSKTKKGFIHRPQDAIAESMRNQQLKGLGKINRTPGAFGKGGIRKAGGQRGS